MLESLKAIYQEPLFWSFPIASGLIGAGAFTLFAAPLTWIAYARPAWAEKYRIQERTGQGDRIIGPSIRYYLVNGACFFTLLVVSWPLLRLTKVHAGPLPPAWVMILQFFLFLYLEDFTFYWLHRALHTKWLYRHIHAIHHRFNVPWAVAGNYMHPVEFILIAVNVLIGPMLVGAHVVTIYIWLTFRQWMAAEGHCGYEFPFNPNRLFPFYEGSAFHDFHHSRFVGNYAGFTPLWDRVFHTLSQGYEEFVESYKRKRRSA